MGARIKVKAESMCAGKQDISHRIGNRHGDVERTTVRPSEGSCRLTTSSLKLSPTVLLGVSKLKVSTILVLVVRTCNVKHCWTPLSVDVRDFGAHIAWVAVPVHKQVRGILQVSLPETLAIPISPTTECIQPLRCLCEPQRCQQSGRPPR
jgi:hypothetical protein